MKKLFYLSMIAAMILATACTSDDLVDKGAADNSQTTANNVMNFTVAQKNQTRAAEGLEKNGYYDFGVYAVKNIDASTTQLVMPNYLVGYYDESNKKGYYGANATTQGDVPSAVDGKSMWFYEGLGKAQYKYSGTESYAKTSPSQNDYQYLKYWDYSSESVDFYAYAPYKAVTATTAPTGPVADGTVYYDDEKKELTIYGIWSSFTQSAVEYMSAYTNVKKTDYGKDVPLHFKRFNGEVHIAFYETITGYDVAIDSIKLYTVNSYSYSKVENGVATLTTTPGAATIQSDLTINLTNGTGTWKPKTRLYLESSKDATTASQGYYKAPTGTSTNANGYTYGKIGETAATASPSADVFYTVPADATSGKENTAFALEVKYTLYSKDTNEKITVTRACVEIPSTYTQWQANTKYTYIFRISKDTSGSTGTPGTDPDGLYPIVFDGVQVDDMDEMNGEWIINPGAGEANPVTNAYVNTTLPTTLTASASEEEGVGYTEFEFSANSMNLPTERVTAKIDVTGSTTTIQSLQYWETDENKTQEWKAMTATDGVYTFDPTGSGFPLENNVPLKLRVRCSEAGTLKAKIQLVGVGGDHKVYGETTVEATVTAVPSTGS